MCGVERRCPHPLTSTRHVPVAVLVNLETPQVQLEATPPRLLAMAQNGRKWAWQWATKAVTVIPSRRRPCTSSCLKRFPLHGHPRPGRA